MRTDSPEERFSMSERERAGSWSWVKLIVSRVSFRSRARNLSSGERPAVEGVAEGGAWAGGKGFEGPG